MAQVFDTNLKEVAILYTKILGAKVTATSVKRDIQENPYYPSLFCLSDTFNKYGIDNHAFEVGSEDFGQLEAPFVAFVSLPAIGKDFVLVTKNTATEVTFRYKSSKPTTLGKETFLERYHGIIWAAELNEHSAEADYSGKLKEENRVKYRRLVLTAASLGLLLFFVLTNVNSGYVFQYFSILLIKLFGLSSCILLLIYEFDKSNAFVRNICSGGSRTNCDAVIGSKAARILGISWAEIGFFYFAGTLSFLLFPSASFGNKILSIAIASAMSAPYIVFSVYYQWRVVRQWCPLCLTVQAVLLSELLWSVINIYIVPFQFYLDIRPVSLFLPCMLLPVIGYYVIKPLSLQAKNAGLYEAAYRRLQYHPDIFKGLLSQQAKAPSGWESLGIDIGNAEAKNTIIKVCNPFCSPCGKIHPVLGNIINSNCNIRLKIIFKVSHKVGESYDKIDATVVKHLLTIAAEGDQDKTEQSLADWYGASNKDYDLFAGKYPLKAQGDLQDEEIEEMGNWCRKAEVVYTPTLFLNGYRMPLNYDVEELKNIL